MVRPGFRDNVGMSTPSDQPPDTELGAHADLDDDPDRTIPGTTSAQALAPVASAATAAEGAGHDDIGRTSADAWPTIGHVGRYALKCCVGEGGLGSVFAAHDPLLARWLAIKTLHVSLPSEDREQFNAIFLNEAQAAGGLSHPHIVTVFDVGAGDGDTYIAMELLRGKDLRHLLASGWRPTVADAALIMRRVADALSYAHHRGVIHRDIKPANIFMVGRTNPKVLDFGIARIRQVEATANDGVSRFGDLIGGSPYYMAPEQIRHEEVDRRADVYAMGVVLYELLTGRRPFVGGDLDGILHAVLTQPLIPPVELDARIPVALSDIVMRAMARDLNVRTRSARMLSQELRVWLDSQAAQEAPAESSRKRTAAAPKLVHEVPARQALSWRGPVMVLAGVLLAGAVAATGWMVARSRAVSPPVPTPVVAAPPMTATPSATPAPLPVVEPVQITQPTAPTASPVAVQVPAAQPDAPTPVATVAAPVTPPAAPLPSAAALPKTPVQPVLPKAKGTLQLAISPWGRVVVDGRVVGVAPPLTQLSLPVGTHRVVIHNDESPAYSQTIQIEAGQAVTVSHAF